MEGCGVTVVGAADDVSLDEVATGPTVACSVDIVDVPFNACVEIVGALVTVVSDVAELIDTVEDSVVDELLDWVDSDTGDVWPSVEVSM